MAEEKQAPHADDATMAQRVAKLEEVMRANDALRRKARIVSLVGVLLILLILTAFVARIGFHLQSSYQAPLADDDRRAEFLGKMLERSNLVAIAEREATMALAELQEGALQIYMKALYANLQTEMPQIEKSLESIAKNLFDYAKTDLASKLQGAFEDGLEQAFTELAEKYPEVADAELEKHLLAAQNHFIERLHQVIETRYAKIEGSLTEIKMAVDDVRRSEGSEQLDDLRQDDVGALMLDALIDLIVYELRPELGASPAAE